jgi:hypothetical protein
MCSGTHATSSLNFNRKYSGRGVNLTNDLYLVRRLGTNDFIPSFTLYTMKATRIYAISATFPISCSDITQAYGDIQVNQYKNMFKHFFFESELRRKAGALLVSVRHDSQCVSSHNRCAVYKPQSIRLCILPAFFLGSCYILRHAAGYFICIVTFPYAITVIWYNKVQNFETRRNKRLISFPWMGM